MAGELVNSLHKHGFLKPVKLFKVTGGQEPRYEINTEKPLLQRLNEITEIDPSFSPWPYASWEEKLNNLRPGTSVFIEEMMRESYLV